jgi:hypothetical protein
MTTISEEDQVKIRNFVRQLKADYPNATDWELADEFMIGVPVRKYGRSREIALIGAFAREITRLKAEEVSQ